MKTYSSEVLMLHYLMNVTNVTLIFENEILYLSSQCLSPFVFLCLPEAESISQVTQPYK